MPMKNSPHPGEILLVPHQSGTNQGVQQAQTKSNAKIA